MKKKLVTLALVCVMAMMLAACGSEDNGVVPTPTPVEKPTEVPTATVTPTIAPTVTPTPEPTATSTPTPEPTATPVPEVTDTYVKGTVTESGFESEWMNLRFTTQPGMIMLSQEELDQVIMQSYELEHGEKAEEILAYESLTTVMEMMAKYANGANLIIQVERLPEILADLSETQYLSIVSEKMGTTQAAQGVIAGDVYTVEIAGETYYGMTLTLDVGLDIHGVQTLLVRKKENRMISIGVSSSNYTSDYADRFLNSIGSFNSEPIVLPTPTPVPDTYVRGEMVGNSFASEWLNLRFTATEDVVLVPRDELPDMMETSAGVFFGESADERVEAAQQTLTFEMMARHTGGSNTLLQVEVLQQGLEYMTEEMYLALLMQDMDSINTVDYVYDENPYTVEIGGETYVGLFSELRYGNGEVSYQEYLVRKKENRMIGIVVTYAEDTKSNAQHLLSLYTSYDAIPVVEPTIVPAEPVEPPTAEPVRGVFTDTGYENEWLGFRFTTPEGAKLIADEVDESVLMYAEWVYGVPAVQVLFQDLGMEMTEEEFLSQLVTHFDSNHIYDENLYLVEVGGQEFVDLSVAAPVAEGVYVYQEFCVKSKGESMFAIVFTYADGYDAELSALVSAFTAY